ncbi:MAG: hypothetical protein GX577_01135 [Leptolinea sp.]|nr:hypothetical protein [Leptolinea sp.]
MPSSSRVIKSGQMEEFPAFNLGVLDIPSVPDTNSIKPVFSPEDLLDMSSVPSETEGDSTKASSAPPSSRQKGARSSVLVKETAKIEPRVWSFPDLARKPVSGKSREQNLAEPQKVEDHSYLLSEAKERADEIIVEADKNAADIITQAQTEGESIKQKAFMEGMAAARAEVSQSMHQVERIVQETQIWQEQVMHQSQGKIIEMVISIGRKMFGHGFQLPAEQIDQIVSRAINEASRLGNLRIYLHPEDAKALVNLWQESELTLNGQQIQIVSSQNISRGGCFVDGQFGVVDGRVEEQVDQIMDSLHATVVNLEKEAEKQAGTDHEPEIDQEEDEQ